MPAELPTDNSRFDDIIKMLQSDSDCENLYLELSTLLDEHLADKNKSADEIATVLKFGHYLGKLCIVKV